MSRVAFADKSIGEGEKTFIIAEAGVNHNGKFELAKKLIEKAAKAGADAVKFQIFKAEKLICRDSRFEHFKKLELTKEQFKELADIAKQNNIIFSASAWDKESADFLEELNAPFFKIGSGDLTNIPLIEHISKKEKPILLSTGASDLDEIKEALDLIKRSGNKDIVLLHCCPLYPAPIEEANLNVIKTLREKFGLIVGYSDHTIGIEVPIAAVALGANVIEKHFTLDKNLEGDDHKSSTEPEELKKMINLIRNVEKSLGHKEKKVSESEKETQSSIRRSIVADVDIPKGTKITEDTIICKRPGTGIQPRDYNKVIGKKAKIEIKKDSLLEWSALE